MFGRIALCSVATFLLVSTGQLCVYAEPLSDANASALIDTTASVRNEAQVPAESLVRDHTTRQTKLAALDPQAPRVKSPVPTEPFGLSSIPWFAGELYLKWKGVEAGIGVERGILARCREGIKDCPRGAQEFLAIVAAGRAQTGRVRIGVINRAINLAIQQVSDLKQWGIPDHWSTPLETFSTHRGDCEDYAIAKFVALLEAGVAPDDVRLVIVRDLFVNEAHAVAAVHIDGQWIMLDNRWLALVKDNEMRRMSPLFVIDHTGVRAYVRLPPQDAGSLL